MLDRFDAACAAYHAMPEPASQSEVKDARISIARESVCDDEDYGFVGIVGVTP